MLALPFSPFRVKDDLSAVLGLKQYSQPTGETVIFSPNSD
jgi:hypothetical protein